MKSRRQTSNIQALLLLLLLLETNRSLTWIFHVSQIRVGDGGALGVKALDELRVVPVNP